MKKVQRPKLQLDQDTTRTLANVDLKPIVGGNGSPSSSGNQCGPPRSGPRR